MRDTRRKTLVIEQGSDLRAPFRIRNAQTGALIDPVAAGYTVARLQVRTASLSEGGDLLANLTTANGGIVLGAYDDGTGTMWSGYLYMPASTTALLTDWGEGVYEMKATHTGGAVDTVAYGPAVLRPSVVEA